MYKEALKKYLDDLAGRLPAPGGGSAAALVAALGVSLMSMVANFTVGKEKYKDFEEEMKNVLSSSESLRLQLTDLVDEDVESYSKLSSAYKLPKDSPAEREVRQKAIQKGLKQALSVPLEICMCCHRGSKLCKVIAEKGNLNLISDVGAAIAFLESAFESALLNVEINLGGIKDEEFVSRIKRTTTPMQEEIKSLKEEVAKTVKDKMS